MRRWLARIGLGLTGLLLLAAGGLAWLALASLPDMEGEIDVAGLERPVTIRRDAFAIPHVAAASAADAWFAMGFLHGQDRLWQMEFNRLLARGRLAELLGPAAVPADRFMRMLNLAARSEAAAGKLDGRTAAWLEAYAAGVNAAIDRFGRVLPPEFLLLRHRPEPWRPADSLLFGKLMALDLSSNWREELLRARAALRLSPAQLQDLWPGDPPDEPTTLAELARLPLERLAAALPEAPPPGIGSNVWVAAGSRTASGWPLLANDPHLALQMPGLWYLARITAPGLEVAGATLPALPMVVLGRNRKIAWGFTNTGSDTQDLFIERQDPADPDRYLTPEGSAPFVRRTETIKVRGAADVVVEVRETRHGPVISDLVPTAGEAAGTGAVLALAWTQLGDTDTTPAAGFAIDAAQDWPGFVAAAELYQGAQQNMAFASAEGEVGMISPGLVPLRRAGDGRLPVPGWSGTFDWVGLIPAGELPRRRDPPAGLLVNANNRLVDGSYRHFLTADWEAPLRARRIAELLEGPGKLDPARFEEVQLDQRSGLARSFLPYLSAAAAGRGELRAALADWDGRMAADRPEPLIFAAWYRSLVEAIAADELGPLFAAYRGLRPDFLRRVLTAATQWCDDVGTAPVETCPDRARRALDLALADLAARYGADWRAWRWGEAHPAVLGHQPFEEAPALRALFSLLLPVGGDGTTVNVAHYGTTRDGIPFGAVHAPGYRAIYDLAAEGRSRWIASTGQSGHPLSRHYRDLAHLWQAGDYLPLDIDAPSNGPVLTLRPAPAS